MIRSWELLERGRLAMEEDRLGRTLRAMVFEHGIERVERTLGEIRRSAAGDTGDGSRTTAGDRDSRTGGSRPTKEKASACVYVARLKMPDEIRCVLEEVAVKYEEKAFLPTSGEIRNFCSVYGIEVPASSSRISAVPRIFKRLAQLGPQEIRSPLASKFILRTFAARADCCRHSKEFRTEGGQAGTRPESTWLLIRSDGVDRRRVPETSQAVKNLTESSRDSRAARRFPGVAGALPGSAGILPAAARRRPRSPAAGKALAAGPADQASMGAGSTKRSRTLRVMREMLLS